MEQVSKTEVKHSSRREPLGFAYFGLVLFLVVYFARPEDWIPGLGAVPLAKITGILVLLALVFSFNSIRWRMPQEVGFLSLLVVQLWLSAALSDVWRGGAASAMLDFSKVLPLVIVLYGAVRSITRLRWILFIQAASVALVAITSIISARTSGGRLRGFVSGVYGNSNDLALVIDLSLPLCLALALTTTSYWKKLAWMVAIFAMIYAVFLTASRGGAIALAVVVLVCLWQLGVKSRRYYLLVLVPVAVVVMLLFGGEGLRERFGQTSVETVTSGHKSEASYSAQERKEVLLQSLKVSVEHPLFGVGPGNFTVVSGVWRATHNTYTQISAEGGLPAFLLYILIIWRGIANLRQVRRQPKTGKEIRLFSMALEASLAAYLVGSFFASDAYQLFPYCLIAYTSSLRLIVQRDRVVPISVPEIHLPPAEVEATVWQ